ncbi:unnamed protein product, partial [Owenia fusiformis]
VTLFKMAEQENPQRNESKEDDIVCQNGQLVCVGQDYSAIPPHIANSYGTMVTRLDLSFNRLRSLDGLEAFTSLEELVLDNNELNDTIAFPTIKRLHTLTLNKNQIRDLDPLLEQIKHHLPNVTYLSLLGNEACPNQLSSLDKDDDDYQRYRHYVLYCLPKLKFLDSTPVKCSERVEAKRIGPFLKVVKPKIDDLIDKSEDTSNTSPSQYSPLPDTSVDHGKHAGTFGKSRYIYYGKHSEGNRFIRNNDL